MNNAPTVQNTDYYTVADIARACRKDKETIRAMAIREQWPMRPEGNRQDFAPPPRIAHFMVAAPASETAPIKCKVKYDDIHDDNQRETVLLREKTVLLYRESLHLGKEIALETTAATMRATFPNFKCSARNLRRWNARYGAYGLDGLVEQKLGQVGRPAFADQLPNDVILRYKAAAIEHGNARKGDGKPQLNKSRAYRCMIADPTIQGPVRTWLHGEHASKSYVPPSIRRAMDTSMLATVMVQRGAKAAKLFGPWTECDYDNGNARGAFTCDDMTANAYVWCEAQNEEGFILIRPQILAAMHVGSMSWLNLHVVMRPKGQYNRDDVWGLIGDVFDKFGVFEIAILEGGIWQNQELTGQLLDDETRFGGLRAMGCRIVHTRSPRGKIIEIAFNSLQHAADRVKGFCGRHEKVDCPETTKAQLAEVESGKSHPRSYFMHLSEYKAHIARVMHDLNHERNDGKICRGLCPKDKWDQDAPQNKQMPDSSKWMYRARYRAKKVTSNGVRIDVGSGSNKLHYTYSHPDLVKHQGRRVAIFWNDHDFDTDAVIYSIHNGKPQELICVAPLVPEIPRVGANEEQTRAESTRKKLMFNAARTETANMADHLQRKWKTPAARSKMAEIGDQLQSASDERARTAKATATTAHNAAKFRDIKKRLASATIDQPDPSDTSDAAQQSRDREEAVSPTSITANADGSYDYQMQPSGDEHAQYVDYLMGRLTEFRKAGASFGQAIGNVSLAVTMKIAKSHLGCDLHDTSRFEDVCAYLKSKIDATILGKRNIAQGTANYHAFEEHISVSL